MKKLTPVCFASFVCALSLGAFPLEWNINNKVSVPYEVEISRAKLAKLANAGKNCGFEVTATTQQGKKQLDVTLLEGKQQGSVALRFNVPAGTSALDCKITDNGKVSVQNKKINLFDGVLTNASAWKKSGRGTVKAVDGKMLFENSALGEVTYSCTVDVPKGVAGCGAKLELDFKSYTPEPWPGIIFIEQLDASGKVLSESLTDPRWLTLMRPPNVLTAHRESGRFHPEAAKISLKIKARGYPHRIGSNGMKIKDKTALLPKFEISRLSVRAAEEIPFPKYRDEFFAPGISGKTGDFAFDTTKGRKGKTFFYATHSQACWAEAKTISNYDELFYPAGEGTVEAWFKPVWKKKSKTPVYLFSADPHSVIGPMNPYGRRTKSCLSLQYTPKNKSITVDFQDYTRKHYQKKFICELPSKKWSHVAVQWGVKNGMQIFLNGKKVFDDPKFTFTPVDFDLPLIRDARYRRYRRIANEYMASQFSLGNDRNGVRGVTAKIPHYRGQIDLLRVSSVKRYNKNFTPATSFKVDKETRALFDFNRSFDGKSGGGMQFISGTAWAEVPRVDSKITVNGKTIDYIPPMIADDNNPDKVLDKRNYLQVPNAKDFVAARKSEQLVFDFKGNEKKTVDIPGKVFMDFIEYKNTGNKTVIHPFIRRDGEIDPRSFADIRRSMNLSKLTQKERLNRIFQFMLSASDYYASHQLYFEPGSDKAENACYKALTMLNSYCGFECGPLNNTAANMFTCAGLIPASQTAGYGHSFQQAWVDGKSVLYDLSAQKFFPSFDNVTPAGLGETELEPGIFDRAGSNCDSYIRLGTREYVAWYPAFTERAAMELRPGETLRMWFANNGRFNDLQYTTDYKSRNIAKKNLKDVSALVHVAKSKYSASVLKLRRIFPEYGSTFLYFNNTPAKFAKTFTKVNAANFCYNVVSCYPIVYAEYAAKLKDGSFAELEISTDRGKTFRKLERDADGTARPFYPVCARREYLIRVNAPIEEVANFNAMTQMITNPRVMTGKLAPGKNELIYTAENNADVKVTMQYRKYAKDIDIKGEVIRSGAQKGFERLTTAIAPGEEKSFNVTGVSDRATVKTTGKLKAELQNGTLTLSVPDGDVKGIESVSIVDDGAEKQLIVVIYPGIELVTAKDITPLNRSELADNEIQKCVNLNGGKAMVKINLKKTKPAGKYSVWNCFRTSNKIKYLRVVMVLPDGDQQVFRHLNTATELLKSKFYGDNDRGKFSWTCHNDHYYVYPAHEMNSDFDSLTYKVVISREKYIELAGSIVLPYPDEEFFDTMVESLCGLNHNKWYIDEINSKR